MTTETWKLFYPKPALAHFLAKNLKNKQCVFWALGLGGLIDPKGNFRVADQEAV